MTRAQEIMAIALLAAFVLVAIIIIVKTRVSSSKYKNFKKLREANINAFKKDGFLPQDAKIANDILAVYFDYTNRQFLIDKYNVLKYETKLYGPYSMDKLKKVSLLVDGEETVKDYMDGYKTVVHEDGTVDQNKETANSIILALYFDDSGTDKLEFELFNQKALKVSSIFKKCFSTANETRLKFEEIINADNK